MSNQQNTKISKILASYYAGELTKEEAHNLIQENVINEASNS